MTTTLRSDYLGDLCIELDPAFVMDKHILEKGVWERHIVEYLMQFVKPGGSCVDVGANAGYHTLSMALLSGPSGRVFAFEPSDVVFSKLLRNIELNPALKERIRPYKLGLSDSPGELKLFKSGEGLGNSYLATEYNSQFWNHGGPDEYQTCPVDTLDNVLKGERVDFMKIDVEGMECKVLRGAASLLSTHRPVVIFETSLEHFDHNDILASCSFLGCLGYLLFAADVEKRKLVETIFPRLKEDTIAIHATTLVHYAEILHNAALYEIDTRSWSNVADAPERVVLVGAHGRLFAKWTMRSGEEILSSGDVEGGGEKVCSCLLSEVPHTLTFTRPLNETFVVQRHDAEPAYAKRIGGVLEF